MGKFKKVCDTLGTVEKGNFRYTLEIDESIFEILEPSEVPEFSQRQEWEEQLTTKDYIQKRISELVLDKFDDISGEIQYWLKDKNLECGDSAGGVKGEDGEVRQYIHFIPTMKPMLEG